MRPRETLILEEGGRMGSCHVHAAPKVMSLRRRSKTEHTAKKNAFQKVFWQLKTGKEHDITDFNAQLFSKDLISEETRAKSDISETLSEVKGRLDCKEGVFDDFVTVLSNTYFGQHLVTELESCYEEQLKELTDHEEPARESTDMQYTIPFQTRLPSNSTSAPVVTKHTMPPQPLVTTDGVYHRHPQTVSEQDPHSSQPVEHTLTSKQDSACAVGSSHLSDASCPHEDDHFIPSTDTEQEVPVCRSLNRPMSTPQQETVGPPQTSRSAPSQVTRSDPTEQEIDDLIELQRLQGRRLSAKHYKMRDLEAQLSYVQEENETLRQQIVELKKAMDALKMENTQLKADTA